MQELCRAFGMCNNQNAIINTLNNVFLPATLRQQEIVFVCVGDCRVCGDCFGAVVGNILLSMRLPIFVFGSVACNVDAHNLRPTLQIINMLHPSAVVVVVDSLSTTDPTTIGNIIISDEYVGLNKRVKICADLFIYGVTTYLSPTRHNLHSKLAIIQKLSVNLAKCIRKSIAKACRARDFNFLQNVVN